jgi:hypothetical protein
MKVTRRELVALAVAGTAVTTAPAQDSPEDQYRKNAEAMEKVGLPMATEPAFAFKV